MADIVSPEKRSRMMAGIRGKNTRPEMIVRRTLFSAGYRYRLYRKDLPGTPDIVLPKYRCVIFVNGCFWHGHENCRLFRLPKSNTEFWRAKIEGNIARNRQKYDALAERGWRIIIVWECAMKGKYALSGSQLIHTLANAIHNRHEEVLEIEGQKHVVLPDSDYSN